jgi:predicted glycoside hydrolase/deacetylase ChbG (UPF0249 family)
LTEEVGTGGRRPLEINDGRYLVVNADDFGMSPGVSRGILAAHASGIVTSTSLMVRPRGAAEAVELSRDYPGLGLGLHVDLCEWEFTDGEWRLVYEVVPLQNEAAVAAEIQRQYECFRDLVGEEPTHLDSHQHFHLRDSVRPHLTKLAKRIGVPVRQCTPGLQYVSRFYGQSALGAPEPEAISVDGLITVLSSLPSGISELACHPGDASDVDTRYKAERTLEQQTLCDPDVRAAIEREKITLCTFADVRNRLMLE